MSRFSLRAFAQFCFRLAGYSLVLGACSLGSPKSSAGFSPGDSAAPVAIEEVYLEIHAIDGSTTPPQQLSQPVRLLNGADQSLVTPAPVRVHGTINLGTNPVDGASISFTGHGGIPNRPLPPLQTTTAADGTFDLLLPDGSYSVVAYPPPSTTTTYPPQYFTDISTDMLPLPTYVLWDYNALPKLPGFLQLMDGTPAAGVQVSALDGSASSIVRHLLSTPVVTSDAGGFTLSLPPVDQQPTSLRLHVASGAPAGMPFPAMDTDETFLAGTSSAQTVGLNLATAAIIGHVRDSTHTVVQGARVIVIAQPTALGAPAPFVFQDSATTGDDGAFLVHVYTPGDGGLVNYSVIAVPGTFGLAGSPGVCRPTSPSGAALTPMTNALAIGAGETLTQDLSCDTLLTFQGLVRTSDVRLTPVASTRVTATLAGTVDLPAGLTFQTKADLDGNFVLALTPGSYDFAFAPPDGSGQPFTLHPARQVNLQTNPPDSATQSAFPLLPPFELTGKLYLGNAQTPLAAQLDAYQVYGTTAIKIASTITGRDGRYSLLLPGSSANP
jgi:hypothetical protein